MSETKDYKLKTGTFTRMENGERKKYATNSIVSLSDEEYAAFKNKFEVLNGDQRVQKADNDDIVIVIKGGKKLEPDVLKKELIKKMKKLLPKAEDEEDNGEENSGDKE